MTQYQSFINIIKRRSRTFGKVIYYVTDKMNNVCFKGIWNIDQNVLGLGFKLKHALLKHRH